METLFIYLIISTIFLGIYFFITIFIVPIIISKTSKEFNNYFEFVSELTESDIFFKYLILNTLFCIISALLWPLSLILIIFGILGVQWVSGNIKLNWLNILINKFSKALSKNGKNI